MINVGFIGLGGMGRYQIDSFAKVRGCRIVAGADLVPTNCEKFTKQYPDASVYSHHRKLLANSSVDAMVVAVPTGHHHEIVIDVMRSGRPVLCEKPMARTVLLARRMIETSKRTRQLLMIAHCRRFDADWGRFAKIIRDGVLGRPVIWRSASAGVGPGGWYMDEKLGGGPMLDGAVHNYDFGNWLFGDPVDVVASSIKLSPRSATDTATAIVRYPKGDQLMLSWTWSTPGSELSDALGPKAGVVFGPGKFADQANAKGKAYYCVTDIKGNSKLVQSRKMFNSMYENQAKHFLACIDKKAKCESPGTEAIKAVAVAEAILKVAPKGGKRSVRW